MTLSLRDQLENPERRIADMERMKIDLSVLSIAPPHFCYNLDGESAVQGDIDPVGTVEALAELSRDQRSKIMGENARSLFGIA